MVSPTLMKRKGPRRNAVIAAAPTVPASQMRARRGRTDPSAVRVAFAIHDGDDGERPCEFRCCRQTHGDTGQRERTGRRVHQRAHREHDGKQEER